MSFQSLLDHLSSVGKLSLKVYATNVLAACLFDKSASNIILSICEDQIWSTFIYMWNHGLENDQGSCKCRTYALGIKGLASEKEKNPISLQIVSFACLIT